MTPALSLPEVVAESRAYVEGLDRTPLGRFAVHPEALIAVDAFERIMDANTPANGMDALYQPAMDNATIHCIRHSTNPDDVRPEMYFWWRSTGDDLWRKKEYSFAVFVYQYRMDRLQAAHSHPEMHDYFAAGIWDVDFIRQCIADGIDAELASSMDVV